MSSPTVAPCSHDAARFAVMHWHYSQAMPAGKLVKHGVWEDGEFVGAILYGMGANNALARPYDVVPHEACELVRIAMRRHEAPVTQVLARSLRMLRETNPGLRLVISYADPEQGHHGGVYQAGGWLYDGVAGTTDEYVFRGKRMHGRSLRAYLTSNGLPRSEGSTLDRARRIDPDARAIKSSAKHRYLMPLDKAMRRQLRRTRELPEPPRRDEVRC